MKDDFRLHLKVTIFGLVFMSSIIGLSVMGPHIGLTRGAGLAIWAAAMLVLTHVMFVRDLLPHMRSPRALYIAEAVLVLVGILVYLFPHHAAKLLRLLGSP